jgi:hypothetical protein
MQKSCAGFMGASWKNEIACRAMTGRLSIVAVRPDFVNGGKTLGIQFP